LNKVRSTGNSKLIYDWTEDLNEGDLCEQGHQLRPHIVWFGEMVPMLEPAIQECETADIFIIIGTSMQVYPAAGLISYAKSGSNIYYIDPKPNISHELRGRPGLQIIAEKATIGVIELVDKLLKSIK
ncbi:MAG: Sir2 family NAD-dependent protein deacetylase, partial [Saprospiraceae bacterium]